MKRVNIKYLVISLILILSLVLGASCDLLPKIDTQPSESPPATETDAPINPEWESPPPDGQASPLPDFTAVVERVKPSVVAINVDFATLPPSAGSGWIIDEDGLIVTNSHVVHGAESVSVTLDDGRTFPAEMVRTDPRSDLAVVKINAQNLPAADIGDSSRLKVGEPTAAIGNALGLGISMKGGWISRLDVSVTFEEGQTLYGLIETDAAINPGNSGGPLVNMAGEVIGITSAKLIDVDVEGIGYAISINSAIPIIEDLINRGYVIRPFLGVSGLLTVNQAVASSFSLSVDKGAMIRDIVPDSPAAEAGLQPEDVIVGVDDEEITTVEDLIQAIHSKQIGQRVKITYWRGNTRNTTYATLTETLPPA